MIYKKPVHAPETDSGSTSRPSHRTVTTCRGPSLNHLPFTLLFFNWAQLKLGSINHCSGIQKLFKCARNVKTKQPLILHSVLVALGIFFLYHFGLIFVDAHDVYIEVFTNVMVLEDGTFERWMGHKGGAQGTGVSTFINELIENWFERCSSVNQEARLHQARNP